MKILFIASAGSIHSIRWINYFVYKRKMQITWITLSNPNNTTIKEFEKGITGIQVAESISSSLKKAAIACSIDGILSDLSKEINLNCKFTALNKNNEHTKNI